MKNLLFILMLLVGVNNSYGQHYFNKVDGVHSFEGYFTSVIERNGKYYCTGTSVDSINDLGNNSYVYMPGVRFTVFDSMGIKIRDTFYQHPIRETDCWHNNMHSLPNGDFVLIATSVTQDSIVFLNFSWVMRFDSTGTLLAVTEIPKPFCTDNEYYSLKSLAPTGTGEWIALGNVWCGIQADPVLTKLDSNFNVIWNKHFPITYNNYVSKVVVLDNGDYLLGSSRTNNGLQGNNFFYNAMVIRTDTSGTQQWWWWSDQDTLICGADDIKETQDGGYVYIGLGGGIEVPINVSSSETEFSCWIEKIDPSGNVVWNKFLSPHRGSPSNLLELEDGSLVIGGTVYSGFDGVDTTKKRFAFLKKMSATGNTIWERLYLPPSKATPQVYDVRRTSDGGFVLAGSDSYFPWILKVDSNGCEQGAGVCNPTDVEETIVNKTAKIKAYPNPAGNVLYIEGAEDKASYRLLNITGSVIRKGTFHSGINQLDLQDLATGMYILHTGSDVLKVVKE